jgi:uncharacterized protein YbjT (DUF2867 family)
MIVITTPTGNIGSQVVTALLAAGEPIRVVARDPSKLPAGLEAIAGSSDDEAVLTRALAGAEALFHCVPPDFRAPDVDAHYLQFTRPAIAAMKAQGVRRVVTVSGIGRKSELRAGAVSAALAKDIEFERAGLDVRALWCPGFMDNMLRAIPTIRAAGAFFFTARGDHEMPLVATRDIAAVAARLLRDRTWRGHGGEAVLGPADVSLDEMAVIASDVLGVPVRYQQLAADAYKAQLMQHGASEAMAAGLVEMFAAKDRGLDHSEPRTAANSTPTTFRAWCTEVLRPAYLAG